MHATSEGGNMCLILFANDCHPRYQLVVAANRDEFYKRPTLPADFWPDDPDILAGKDVKEGGTWMGITRSGEFAALTNYRDPASFKPQAPSRGHLVLDYLKSGLSPVSYLKNLPDGAQAYNGFNLLAGNLEALYYYSNREKLIRQAKKGVHGLSNSLLDVPWPKVKKGILGLTAILQTEEIDVEDLFTLMADREIPDDKDLPSTGVGLNMERWLAPAYVISPDYGTRTTTVLLIERTHKVFFRERSFTVQKSNLFNEVCYEFDVNQI